MLDDEGLELEHAGDPLGHRAGLAGRREGANLEAVLAPQREHLHRLREPLELALDEDLERFCGRQRREGRQLQEYLGGTRTCFDLSLDLRGGTPFQQSVWRALLAIPRGATVGYGALALALGQPRAVRAVATAIGRNPLSVIVPLCSLAPCPPPKS